MKVLITCKDCIMQKIHTVALRWSVEDTEKARECERAFQAGGPRVYTCEGDGRMRPSGMSAAATVRCAFPGTTVYSRRKVGNQYIWHSTAA